MKDSLASAIARLTADRVPSPRMNAELLLMFTLNCDRAYLYAHPERELTPDEQSRYDAALAERCSGKPAQYITGHQEFWGMDLIVTPAVLIPRPETEHVVEAVLELAGLPQGLKPEYAGDSYGTAEAVPFPKTGNEGPTAGTRAASDIRRSVAPRTLRIADVGTGSGCIALALAKELPQAEIQAIDISAAALEIARANAARHQLDARIHFQQADLLSETPRQSLDFVVSNPPYVGQSEAEQVQLEVRKFEPKLAVFAGATGLEVIEKLVPQALQALKPSGWLVMEISGAIADRVPRLLRDWQRVSLRKDLQGIPRVAVVRKP